MPPGSVSLLQHGESMTQGDRRASARRGMADRRVNDRRTSEDRAKPACPKCGTERIAFTTGVTSDSDRLSLFRCEVCDFRFTVGGTTNTWYEPDRRLPPGLA